MQSILGRLRDSDSNDDASTLQAVYHELHAIATQLMRGERDGHTLQATALVHEFWLKMMPDGEVADVESVRKRMLAYAARGMRQVLIDHARRQQAQKRGGDRARETFCEPAMSISFTAEQVLDLEDGIRKLEKRSPRVARVAELRLFTGLSPAEAADVLGIARSTAIDDWALARALLSLHLTDA